jgi:hypothetical protein
MEICSEGVDWTGLPEDRVQWRAVENTRMKFAFNERRGKFID